MTTPRHLRLFAVVAGCLWAAHAGSARGAEYLQRQGRASAALQVERLDKEKAEIRLSAQPLLTLSVEGPATLQVQPVERVTTSAGWKTRSLLAATLHQGDDRRRWQQSFELEPSKPGELPLQLIPLRFRDGPEEGWQEVTWQAIPVVVTTEVMQADLKELRDVTPPEELPPVRSASVAWLVAIAVLVLTALGLGAWHFRKRSSRLAPAPSPEQWAQRELQRIEALALPALGEIERYHTLLSDVVRRYLELRFELHAPQQTTAEFLEAMRQSPQLEPAQEEVLRDFLQRCDLAKFARVEPSPEECQAAAAMAAALVQQTRQATSASPG